MVTQGLTNLRGYPGTIEIFGRLRVALRHGISVGSLNDAEHSLPLLLDMIVAPFANLFYAEALSGHCTLPQPTQDSVAPKLFPSEGC